MQQCSNAANAGGEVWWCRPGWAFFFGEGGGREFRNFGRDTAPERESGSDWLLNGTTTARYKTSQRPQSLAPLVYGHPWQPIAPHRLIPRLLITRRPLALSPSPSLPSSVEWPDCRHCRLLRGAREGRPLCSSTLESGASLPSEPVAPL